MKTAIICDLISGSPQFRIQESLDDGAPTYFFYGQLEIDDDLTGLDSGKEVKKQVRTFDNVNTVKAGDVIFSLISGKAAIVRQTHEGYLFTQNYVVLVPAESINEKYLVYMLNENSEIKRQLHCGQQGSATLKHSIRQLSDLIFPNPPPIEKQRIIGDLYLDQVRLAALRNRVAATETMLVLQRVKEANRI